MRAVMVTAHVHAAHVLPSPPGVGVRYTLPPISALSHTRTRYFASVCTSLCNAASPIPQANSSSSNGKQSSASQQKARDPPGLAAVTLSANNLQRLRMIQAAASLKRVI